MVNQNPTQNVLNVVPLHFQDEEVEVGYFNFTSSQERDEALRKLRHDHRGLHVFRRDGSLSVVMLPIAPGVPLLGETPQKLCLEDHLGLCAVLMREALLNFRARRGLSTRG